MLQGCQIGTHAFRLRTAPAATAAADRWRGADGVGIWLSASEHDGSFTAANTVAESPAGVTVVAGTCTITRQGKPVDCSTSTVADDLAAQAQEALTEGP